MSIFALRADVFMQQYLFKLLNTLKYEYGPPFLNVFVKNPKYVNVYVLRNTFKYAFVYRQRVYTEIRSYLVYIE